MANKEITANTDYKDLRSEKMRSAPIGKLLLSMSLPAIISMMVQALYNIVDSMYVTRITNANNYALEAVSLAFPMAMFVNSLAIGIGVGANALIARYLGERNNAKANDIARTALIMAACGWVVFAIMGVTLSRAFVTAFAKGMPGEAEIIQMGTEYLTIYMVGSLGVLLEIPAMRMLQATGNMKVPMISQLVGALCNIALDPVFIWTFDMGVAGAAVATVISQWVSLAVSLGALIYARQDISINFKGYKFKKDNFFQIAKLGGPNFVMNAIMSFVTMGMYSVLKNYTDGISTMSSYAKLQSFVYMPVFGLTQGATPILAYNYGALNRKRYSTTLKYTLFAALGSMFVGVVVFHAAPSLLVRLFNPTPNMLELAKRAYRIISIAFVPSALGIVAVTGFQSLGLSLRAMLMSLTRTVGFVLPTAFLLNFLFADINAVWYCYPIAEVLSLAIFLPIFLPSVTNCFMRKAALEQRLSQVDGQEVNNDSLSRTASVSESTAATDCESLSAEEDCQSVNPLDPSDNN